MREIPPQYENHRNEYEAEENEYQWNRRQSRIRIVTDPRDPDYIAPEEDELNAYPAY